MREPETKPSGRRDHGKRPGDAAAPASGKDEARDATGDRARRRIDTEDEVAEASDESFPASDPPSFNPGRA